MNDNEIIKDLEEEIHLVEYVDADYSAHASLEMLKGCLDLINRQKAEIERLKAENEGYKHLDTILHTAIDKLAANIKSEAVREFAEKLKSLVNQKNYLLADIHNSKDFGMFTLGFEQVIDEIVKEMTEGENG